MITAWDIDRAICSGKPLFYHYGFGNYCEIRPLHITKTEGRNFWFDAMITDNQGMDKRDQVGFYKVDNTSHSFSNSFIYISKTEMLAGRKVEKQSMINFVSKFA